ncbi:MAG: murein biosynthesis integral membrane protein MurJ [Planctomycetota bacterium]|jgi:putative peptidoglycan lipid II flippase
MSRTIQRASAISLVTLGSRVLGLVRDALMFSMLRASWAAGAFWLAWMIPNLLRRLFGEGALSAAFVPAYAKALDRDGPKPARRLLASVSGLLLVSLGGVTAVAWLLCLIMPPSLIGTSSGADPLAGGGATAQQHGELLLDLLAILFPYAIPICLVAVLAGALNCHGVFALPAAAPIVLNLFWIGGLVVALATGMDDLADIVVLVAWCLVAAGGAQLLLVALPLARRGHLPPPRPAVTDESRAVLRGMAPTVVGMSVLQISALLDQGIAVYLIDPGANSYIVLANRLLLFPHALISLALATVVFPDLAVLAARENRIELRHRLDRAVFQTLFVALPASLGMMLVAAPLIEVVFQHVEFTAADAYISTWTTICLVAALPAIGVAQLHARALYALNDYKTPARVAVWLLLLNLVLNVVFVLVFDLGVPGLAFATTLCALINAWALRQRLLDLCPDRTAPPERLLPVILATVLMGALVYITQQLFDADGLVQKIILDLLLPVLVGIGTYAGFLHFLKVLRQR